MSERVRLAFTIGYIGRYFHGSQIQPDVRTVQGELIRVFHKLKWLNQDDSSHNLVLSSRTDAG
ncbi:MAG: tRNA pseudouridine(38-40) synthase TruA, partial [Candidatus Thermoplasmatota archaeon]|nr:tRNA pseudouridine(38-40) synthase TruA [Candidatus Thermoplasmatota archaeon]